VRYFLCIAFQFDDGLRMGPVARYETREAVNQRLVEWRALHEALAVGATCWIYDFDTACWFRWRHEDPVPVWVHETPPPHRVCTDGITQGKCRCRVCAARPREAPLWVFFAA
jgi:hypothetical protein